MNSKILLPFLLFALNACSNTNPILGKWTPKNSTEEWLISEQSNKFNVTVTSNGVNQGIFPAEVTDKGFTMFINLGLGSGQYNCSFTANKDEMDCNSVVTTLLGRKTTPFKIVRKQ